jgi:hypothetical protein
MKAYLILACVLLLVVVYGAGNVQGRKAERALWELRVAQQGHDAARQLAAAETTARMQERAIAALKETVEQEHSHAVAKIEAVRRAASVRLTAAGGLRDANGSSDRACRADNLPGDAPAAAGAATSPSGGCQLSAGTSQALLDLAALADHTAAYAAACHAWAMKTAAALK